MKKVISRIQSAETDSDSAATYQAVKLVHYDEGIDFLTSHKNEIVESVLACLKNWVTWNWAFHLPPNIPVTKPPPHQARDIS